MTSVWLGFVLSLTLIPDGVLALRLNEGTPILEAPKLKDAKEIKDTRYHKCTGRESEIRMYTVSRTSDRTATVNRDECVDKQVLDSTPSSSYIILTMADAVYNEHLKQLLTSLGETPQKGGLPTRVVVVDTGLEREQIRSLQEVSPVPLQVEDYRKHLAFLNNIDDIPEVLIPRKREKEVSAGAPYRLKAFAIDEWLHKMTEEQLIWMDAGGIVLGSLHRLRNFVDSEGFYAGALKESALSAMFANAGTTPPDVRAEREQAMTMKGHMPQCFNYQTDHLIDDTHDADDKSTMQLGSFEGGFIAVDRRHDMPVKLVRTWANIMKNNTLWAEHQGYYFAHDQKILTNEIWKMAICSKEPGTTRLLDIDNVRFGSVAKLPEEESFQEWKEHGGEMSYSLHRHERTPWAGYAYHFCMDDGSHNLRHPCGIMQGNQVKDDFPPDGWRAFAAQKGASKQF